MSCARAVRQVSRRVGTGVGEADDRLALEELTHQVAEVRGVYEGAAVLDLTGGPDDCRLSECLDGLHATKRVDQLLGDQACQARRNSFDLAGEIACGAGADPRVVYHHGDAGLSDRPDGLGLRLGDDLFAVHHDFAYFSVSTRFVLLHATARYAMQ